MLQLLSERFSERVHGKNLKLVEAIRFWPEPVQAGKETSFAPCFNLVQRIQRRALAAKSLVEYLAKVCGRTQCCS